MSKIIKLGARPSRLALIQADQVKQQLLAKFPFLSVDIIPIKTEGDLNQTASLKELGGKGVFIKEIERKLLDNEINAAVHSFKDITATIASETILISFLAPEAISDSVVITNNHMFKSLQSLPKNSIVATSSLRRKLYLKNYFPHLKVKDIRGNVETRINKCKSGFADAVILSKAGLLRLELGSEITETLPVAEFVPAPGQGVVTVQTHQNDDLNKYFEAISDPNQQFISNLEYLFLKTVGLDCNYPLGLFIEVKEKKVKIYLKWASLNMNKLHEKIYECNKEAVTEEIKKIALHVKETI